MIDKNSAEHYNWGDGWHLVKSPTLSVIQERVPPGRQEMSHYHNKSEQFFFILSGTATLILDGVEIELQPQQAQFVPSGAIHQLNNMYTEDLIFTVTSSPPSHGDRVVIE